MRLESCSAVTSSHINRSLLLFSTGWTATLLVLKQSRSVGKSLTSMQNKLKRKRTTTEVLKVPLFSSALNTTEKHVVDKIQILRL